MKKLMGVIAMLVVGWVASANAEPVWTAQWIGLAQPSGPNAWFCYRKEFQIGAAPKQAQLRIACDSKYWLWVNGRLIVFEGELKRTPSPDGTYFDTIDLARQLEKGTNTLAVLMQYFGKRGYSHNDSGKAGLVCQLDIGTNNIVSDRSWRVLRDPAFGNTGDPHPNYRLPEDNIAFDASKEPMGWMNKNFNDTNWPQATEFGLPPCAPWGVLFERPIPQWRNSGLHDYANASELKLPKTTNGVIFARLPYDAQVTPWFKISAPRGLKIDVRTDDYTGGGAENVRAEYITRDGEQEFECLSWMNGHWVKYTFPPGVTVLALKYRETGCDVDFTGDFHCDDAALNALWEKARRTLYVTMRDNYMDCPDRERGLWWGDVVNEIGETFYAFDAQRSPALARKSMLELARWQRPDGVLFAPMPGGMGELPQQMLASVGWYGFWTYYRYSGDRATLTNVYPAVKRYLALWQIGKDGLVIHRNGNWDWTDWGGNIDGRICENAWLYLALRAAADMAALTDHKADIEAYRNDMKSIEGAFNKTFWSGKEYRSPGYGGVTDDRANAMAVVAGFAKPDQYSALRAVFEQSYESSPYMEKYVLEALYLMNTPEQAVARMKKRYDEQIKSPLTTLWEGWGLGDKGYGGGTYNHGWSGGPLTLLCQYAAGIAPIEPGFKTWQINPQPGPLKQIHCVVPTPFGNLSLDWTNTEQTVDIIITAPPGTSGTFQMPTINGVYPSPPTLDGRNVNTTKPIVLRPGKHHITARIPVTAK